MIHQALHGYADGHGLLATSLTLSREQRTALSLQTDLSGPAPLRGFDGYLSGYAITGGIYVLSRTWYATELPRPGCVWTHSLLLTPDVLDWDSISALAQLLQRPEQSAKFDRYSIALSRPKLDHTGSPLDLELASALVDQLYGDARLRVCVPTESAAEVEATFLAIWNQQWPNLRREFAFTTGLLGTGARPFDLQAVPAKNRRLFLRASGFSFVERESVASLEPWVERVSMALGSKDAALQEFLWRFGPQFEDGRKALRGLTETHRALTDVPESGSRATAAHSQITRFFRKPGEAAALKVALFGGTPNTWAVSEPDALELLARDATILDESAQNIRARAFKLSGYELEALVQRLLGVKSATAESIEDAFFEKCTSDSIGRLPVELASSALNRRAELGRDSAVWQSANALALLKGVLASGTFNEATAYGLLRHGDVRLLYEAKYASARAWIRAARELFDASGPSERCEEFILDRLWNAQSELRAVLHAERFGAFLKPAAAALDLSDFEAKKFPIAHATDVLLPKLHDAAAELQACGFLLIIGLVRSESEACRFVAEGFSPIYLAARDQRLPWDIWRRLESHLPWHFLEWDRCARLIEGTVTRFADRSWPPSEFFRTFSNEEEFERAVSTLGSMRKSEFLGRLRAYAETRGREGTFQRRVLSRLTD